MGDLGLTTPLLVELTVSSGIILASNLVFPAGFTPLSFTGKYSTIGQMDKALWIQVNPPGRNIPITITLPQLSYPPLPVVRTRYSISILRFDPALGIFSHFSADSYIMEGSSGLLTITAKLPDGGFYIFGHMDFTKSNLVPVSTNYWFDYLKEYNTLQMRLDNGNLVASLRTERNSRVVLMRPPTLNWSPDGYDILHSVFLGGDVDRSQATFDLIYRSNQANMTWRYIRLISFLFFHPNITSGSRWVLDKRTIVSTDTSTPKGYTATITTHQDGHWAVLVPRQRVITNDAWKYSISIHWTITILATLILL